MEENKKPRPNKEMFAFAAQTIAEGQERIRNQREAKKVRENIKRATIAFGLALEVLNDELDRLTREDTYTTSVQTPFEVEFGLPYYGFDWTSNWSKEEVQKLLDEMEEQKS
jgi:hypothetical protein